MERHLALFDFDGTLTKRDSLFDFIQFSFGYISLFKGMIYLFPVLVKYYLGVIDNNRAKQKIYTYYFSGFTLDEFKGLGKEYAFQRLPEICILSGIERIYWHLGRGHDVVIVSASIDVWLSPWAESLGIEVISTRLEYKNGFTTGRYAGKNCHGKEKVLRINIEYNLEDYEKIYAYGDSAGDKFMLDIADESYYQFFK